MKPQWDAQITQLTNALQNWEANFPNWPQAFTYQGHSVSTSELDRCLKEIVDLVTTVSNSDVNAVLLLVHQPNVISVSSQIFQAVANLASNPQQYFEQLVSNIWSLRSSLVWLIPEDLRENLANTLKDLDAVGKLETTQQLLEKLIDASSTVETLKVQSAAAASSVQTVLAQINGYEREASTAKTNAESSSQLAASNKDNIATLLAELEQGTERYKILLSSINELADKAQLVLEGTSKAGLAASFGKRRSRLENSQLFWGICFGAGIAILITGILATTAGWITFTPLINSSGVIDPWGALARLMLTGPAIWFTWFAAKQYGHTTRLIEDYAFKEAAALAFVGYKREMGDDDEMLKLLRETAIKNFGASPTRMLAKEDAASPMHELVDKALEDKGIFDRLIELLKAMKPVAKS